MSVGIRGQVCLTTRTRRGRPLRVISRGNLETNWATAGIASWLAAGTPLITPQLPPRFMALGTGPMNLLTAEQADMEAGIVGWAAVSNCAIAQSQAAAWQGVSSLRMTASSGGSMTVGTPTGTGGVAITQGDGVEAYSYMAAAHLLAGSTGRTVTVAIAWYNSAGTLLSTSTGTGVSDGTGAWIRAWVYAAAPANAAYAAVQVTVASAGSSEVHYVDGVQLAYAPDGPYAWADGGISGVPTATDIYLTQERAGTRKGIDQFTSQNQVAIFVKNYQTTDPFGTFTEAGLFDAACLTTSLQSIANAGVESLTLAVGAPAVAAGQPIYIATNPLTPPAAPSFGSASSTGGHLAQSTTYYYVVTATNSLGESTVGTEATYAVPASGTATNQITLSWAAIPGATGYKIYRGTSSGTEQLLDTSATNSYADVTANVPSGAMPTSDTSGGGGEYAVVSAAAAAGVGSWSLNDFLLRSHPAGAVVTVFNGNLWGHCSVGHGIGSAAVKTSAQLLTTEWQLTVASM